MPSLTRPTTRVHASFLAAFSEFIAEGRGGPHEVRAAIDTNGEFRTVGDVAAFVCR